jgi:hypothetical protein
MLGMIVLYGRNLFKKKKKIPKPKVGVNVAMVDWDQLVVNVCVTTRGQKVKILEVDMHAEELKK